VNCCSDPYAKLLLNGRLVGQTKYINNNINPAWNESFTLVPPLLSPLSDCSLRVEVYDRDAVSEDDLLGLVTVAGGDLQRLLCPGQAGAGAGAGGASSVADVGAVGGEAPLDSASASAKTDEGEDEEVVAAVSTEADSAMEKDRTLSPAAAAAAAAAVTMVQGEGGAMTLGLFIEQKVKGRMKTVPCGQITLRGRGAIVAGAGAAICAATGAGVVGKKMLPPPQSIASVGYTTSAAAAAEEEKAPEQKTRDDAFLELHDSLPQELFFSMVSARGLLDIESLRHWYGAGFFIH
jgi:hypothetical protein